MKLLSYIVKHDTRLAPNPFWNYCTLAVCTPNHVNARLQKDDWILALSSKNTGNKIVYLMKLTEDKMFFNDYFNDNRFNKKKPNIRGNNKQLTGDNLYHINSSGDWEQIRTLLHNTEEERKRDLRNPYVFISNYFFYFGDQRISLNKKFQEFIVGRGIKYFEDIKLINSFIDFICAKYSPGLIGTPLDKLKRDAC